MQKGKLPTSVLGLSGLGFLIIGACSPDASKQGAHGSDQTQDQFNELLVRDVWETSVQIAKPCEQAAAEMASKIDTNAVSEAKTIANNGLKACSTALTQQLELGLPEQLESEPAAHLSLAIIECREALSARKKFFETAINILEGDTSEWRQSLAATASNIAQQRSAQCKKKFADAGLKI